MMKKWPEECEGVYLQLSSGHFEHQLHHRAHSEPGGARRVDLVPDGVAVHLQTQASYSQTKNKNTKIYMFLYYYIAF